MFPVARRHRQQPAASARITCGALPLSREGGMYFPWARDCSWRRSGWHWTPPPSVWQSPAAGPLAPWLPTRLAASPSLRPCAFGGEVREALSQGRPMGRVFPAPSGWVNSRRPLSPSKRVCSAASQLYSRPCPLINCSHSWNMKW